MDKFVYFKWGRIGRVVRSEGLVDPSIQARPDEVRTRPRDLPEG